MWKEKMRLLKDISPQSNHYSTEVKLSILQNAVLIVPKLSSIQDSSNNLVAIGNNPFGYQAYSELLISGCNQLDKDLEVTHSKSKRTVNYTNFKEEDYFDRGYLDAGDSYFTKQNELDPIPNNAWKTLAAESSAQEKGVGALFFPRALWDLIPEEVREYIRNNQEPTRRTRPPPPGGGPPNRGTPSDRRDSYNNGSSTRPPAQRRANVHDLASSNQEADRDEFFDAVDTNPDAPALATMPRENSLLATIQEPLSLRQLLTNTHRTAPAVAPTISDNRTVVIDGKRYVETNTHRIQYRFSKAAGINHRKGNSALVDQGANGGLAGEDVRVLKHSLCQADISGINNHTMVGLPIVTAAGVVNTHIGPVCVILHQYVLLGKGKSIHSSVQMECHDIVVNERSRRLRRGGQQCLTTLEDYKTHLSICRGLPYMDMHPPLDHELDTLPQVVISPGAN